MRRLLPLIPLTLLLALPTAASAAPIATVADGAGHNPATKKLEAAFTRALSERINSANGCYPAEAGLAKTIAKTQKLKTGVAPSVKKLKTQGIVYVLKSSSCNKVLMALRDKSGLYLLDSNVGEIAVLGKEAAKKRRQALAKANRGPLRGIALTTKNVNFNVDHRRDRQDVSCGGKSYPLGGGMITNPPIGLDGEGVYPHSFERLGAQRGWHITAWLYDPSGGSNASRSVTLQAMCAKGLVPESAPHKTAFTLPGQTATVTATCPKGQQMMSGGFQRTDFLGDGGNWVTESRAVGTNAWRVSGRAYGAYGGELTAIAYCIKSKKPLLTEVSASSPLLLATAASATTPACPGSSKLTSGGFSANGSSDTWFGGGFFNANNTWTATGFGRFGTATLTAYGYCLTPGV
jgi:hypothetical protein